MAIEDLKPIQRYETQVCGSCHDDEPMGEHPDGAWCRWEDVEKVLDEVNKQLLDHLTGIIEGITK